MTRRRLAQLAGLCLVVLLTAAAAYVYLERPGDGPSGTAGDGLRLGGPFTLVDQHGRTVEAADFRGSYMLVYFGYTSCPDVCPTTLTTVSGALERLAEAAPDKAERVTPVFVSVDPARDDVATMRDYVGHFHSRLVGLTGSAEQVARAAKAYGVYHAKAEREGDGPYLVDHSSSLYLMGPDGDYLTRYSHDIDAKALAQALNRDMKG